MATHKVIYSGNSTKFRNFEFEVTANSEREAVETAYAKYLDENYFPQEDGSIKDCDGHTVADSNDDTIEYDGGCFYAVSIEEEVVEYVTRDRQAGNIIEEGFATETEVREAISAYESEDLNNGTFEPNFYEACKKLTNGEIISID